MKQIQFNSKAALHKVAVAQSVWMTAETTNHSSFCFYTRLRGGSIWNRWCPVRDSLRWFPSVSPQLITTVSHTGLMWTDINVHTDSGSCVTQPIRSKLVMNMSASNVNSETHTVTTQKMEAGVFWHLMRQRLTQRSERFTRCFVMLMWLWAEPRITAAQSTPTESGQDSVLPSKNSVWRTQWPSHFSAALLKATIQTHTEQQNTCNKGFNNECSYAVMRLTHTHTQIFDSQSKIFTCSLQRVSAAANRNVTECE